MPREYRHIQNYEKEILELKVQGYTLRAIVNFRHHFHRSKGGLLTAGGIKLFQKILLLLLYHKNNRF